MSKARLAEILKTLSMLDSEAVAHDELWELKIGVEKLLDDLVECRNERDGWERKYRVAAWDWSLDG